MKRLNNNLSMSFAVGLFMLGTSFPCLTSGTAFAAIVVDQSNPSMNEWIYNSVYTSNPSTFFSQSFRPAMNNSAGAYVEIYPWTYPDEVTISLWGINPAIDSTNPLAIGTITISTGGGVSIYWDPVPVVLGKEYFIRLQTGNSLQQINSSRGNLYTSGAMYVGTQEWWGAQTTDHDLIFKTYSASDFKSEGGDIDNNGSIDLADAVLSLQIPAGISVTVPVYTSAEISGDDKIGIAEAIYILQSMSELRTGYGSGSVCVWDSATWDSCQWGM